MVRMLVAAGADVNAKMPAGAHAGNTTIAALLFHTVKDKPAMQQNAKEILQVLIGEAQAMPPAPLPAPAQNFPLPARILDIGSGRRDTYTCVSLEHVLVL